MTLTKFATKIKEAFPVGTVVDNPGGGTSTIAKYTFSTVSYIRRNSTIVVAFEDLYDAFKKFEGQHVSSSDLKEFRPSVFDSTGCPAGHSCNCTFLLRVLEKLGLCGQIIGTGVRGSPFGVRINNGSAE